MKVIFSLAILACSISAFAAVRPAIVCKSDDGRTVVSSMQRLNVDDMFETGCGDKLATGDVCYRGARQGAIDVLFELDGYDVLGDEYSLRGIRAKGTNQIAYVVFDGPNEVVMSRHTIKPCTR